MKKIKWLMIIFSILLFLNGCYYLSGMGMESERTKRLEKNKSFHNKIKNGMEKVTNYKREEE